MKVLLYYDEMNMVWYFYGWNIRSVAYSHQLLQNCYSLSSELMDGGLYKSFAKGKRTRSQCIKCIGAFLLSYFNLKRLGTAPEALVLFKHEHKIFH